MREELPNPRAVNDAAKEPGQTVKGAGFFRRHEWTLVGGLAVLAFLLGCHGYAQVMTFGPGGENTPWDIVYATFQLFIFEGETETVGWPPQLQFARALAPMVVLYTAAVAVWRHLRDEAALYGLPGVQGPLGGDLLQGKPLSYNNLLDAAAALRLVGDLHLVSAVSWSSAASAKPGSAWRATTA